ncbi:MAG TPA: M20/M25/M40 family metallo-hydrolase [Brevundimonas sp.]|jgi:hypothetical protein|uniref:M20/M25/M40 family metallo-hydrolase n=1 Tax=Brevundimonas sp. TaxID=1871086 RepID=UPI002E0F5B27|nr:M20/M25/M40 family metallo-hydrolase [Brevundimonas sp.]
MPRLALLLGALAAGLVLAVAALQVPAARPADAPAEMFAAGRAMQDIRRIAVEPHPVGTPAHAQVRAYLFGRMTELGLAPEVQVGVLSPEASQRLERWSDGAIAGYSRVFNLVGVLPGQDRAAPAVLLMAHYDTSWGSPGAADDSAGVAAILEAVRVLQAEGPFERDLVVLLTDAEELNLDGARAFFSEHPLRDRIGLVINLEARGGGGRAMMFETGPGNAETVALYARAAGQTAGGVTGNALATLVYENMPNGTDYTIPKARGIAGLNLAFIGRPDQYHSPTSTPDALDPGALQHLGDQALTLARLALTAETLPQTTQNVVFADLLGRIVIVHPPAWGWALLALSLAGLGFAGWRWRDEVTPKALGRGALEALFATFVAVIAAFAVRGLAGPMGERYGPGGADLYYTLLRRLPWIEAGIGLALTGLLLALLLGRARLRPRWQAAGVAALAVPGVVAAGPDPMLLVCVAAAIGLAFSPTLPPEARRAGALGWMGLLLLIGLALQVAVPTAAFLILWPASVFAVGLAAAALLTPRFGELRGLAPLAVGLGLVSAWLFYQAHPVILGIGMDLPGVAAVFLLLIGAGARLLAPEPRLTRPLALAAAVLVLAGGAMGLGGRFAEPLPPPAAGGPT